VTEFLLELYVARTDCAAVVEGATRLGCAAAQVTAEGRPVRVVRSIFVPQDETCYVLIEAATVDAARETATRAALPVERVVEATHDIGSL
jgi:hypothetical protein